MKTKKNLGVRKALSVVGVLTQIVLGAPASTVGFMPAVTYAVGKAPVAIASGDFNGDGRTDLAIANNGDASVGDDGSVSVLLGKGNGTFQAAENLAAGKNPSAIAVGDFNGDGRLDLAVINGDNGAGKVGILLGNGDGTFQPTVDYSFGNGPARVAVGDLNGDHKLDLVVSNILSGTVSALLGNGDGTFQTHLDYALGGFAQNLAVADFNGDGKMDLAVAHGQGVTILAGNGDGTFHQAWASAPLMLGVGSVSAGDFNQDGKLDLIVNGTTLGNATSASVELLLGNGDGTFSQGKSLDTGACQNRSPLAADFDSDGKLDLAVYGDDDCLPNPKVNPRLLVTAGNGDGTFQTPASLSASQHETFAEAVDLDGNGSPDLVAIDSSAANTVSILLNTAGFDFSVAASALNPSTISHGQSTTSTLSLSALNSFKIPVSLTCSVQPAQAGSPTCSINPSSVAFDASGKAIAQLTVSEGAAAASIRPQSAPEASQPWSFEWFPIVGLALAGAGFQRNYSIRRRVLAIFVGVVLFAGLISQFACDGSSGPKAQEFTVTVNATSGTAQHPTALSLTVQ